MFEPGENEVQDHDDSDVGTDDSDGADLDDQEADDLGDDEEGDLEDEDELEESEDDEESVDEEEDEESEDEESEEDEEEGDEEEDKAAAKGAGKGIKDASGNFDWKKIGQKLGSNEIEKAFKSAQATITRTSQENKRLKDDSAVLQEEANYFRSFDQLVRQNPKLEQAVREALGQAAPGNGSGNGTQEDPFKSIAQDDPLLPVVRQLHSTIVNMENQRQRDSRTAQEQQRNDAVRNGLVGAKNRFVELIGREPNREELEMVYREMRATGLTDGKRFVADLFAEEIQKNATRSFRKKLDKKKALTPPVKGKMNSNRAKTTARKSSMRETFLTNFDKFGGLDT